MKTGIILYMVGDRQLAQNCDIRSEIKKVEPGADRVELVARNTGHFDIADAWWALSAKGMQRILCLMGEIGASGRLELKRRMLRLCG